MSSSARLIEPDVFDETVRLVAAAQEQNVAMRLMGGMAIVMHVGDLLHPAFKREIHDIDVAIPKRAGRNVSEFLAAQGYVPNKTFNAMHGASRLVFYDEPNERQVDVFVGSFSMCHELPLEERLEIER